MERSPCARGLCPRDVDGPLPPPSPMESVGEEEEDSGESLSSTVAGPPTLRRREGTAQHPGCSHPSSLPSPPSSFSSTGPEQGRAEGERARLRVWGSKEEQKKREGWTSPAASGAVPWAGESSPPPFLTESVWCGLQLRPLCLSLLPPPPYWCLPLGRRGLCALWGRTWSAGQRV